MSFGANIQDHGEITDGERAVCRAQYPNSWTEFIISLLDHVRYAQDTTHINRSLYAIRLKHK